MLVRGPAFELRCVDRKHQHEMGEALLHRPRQPAPSGDDRSVVVNLVAWAFDGPRRARQLDRRSEKAVRRTAASEKGAVETAGEKKQPLPARARPPPGAPGG